MGFSIVQQGYPNIPIKYESAEQPHGHPSTYTKKIGAEKVPAPANISAINFDFGPAWESKLYGKAAFFRSSYRPRSI